MATMVGLRPGEATLLPGTHLEVRWDGEQSIAVYQRHDGIWELGPLTHRGVILAWARLADHPKLPWWPLTPIGRPATYVTSARGDDR